MGNDMQMIMDYEDGADIADIMARYGVTEGELVEKVRSTGFVLRDASAGKAKARKVPKGVTAKVRRLYGKGYSVDDIVSSGIRRHDVMDVLSADAKLPNEMMYEDGEKIDEAVTLHESGMSNTEIADRLGFSTAVVRRAMHMRGIAKSGILLPVDEREAVRMLHDGMSTSDIAKHFGVSRQALYNHIGKEFENARNARRDSVVKAIKDGKTYADIVDELGVCQSNVHKIAVEEGLTVRRGRSENVFTRFGEAGCRRIIRDYQNGRSSCSIAKEIGVSTGRVTKFLASRGVEIRTRRTLSADEDRRIRALHDEGWSNVRIAKEIGTTPLTVRKHVAVAERGLEWSDSRVGNHNQSLTDEQVANIIRLYGDGLSVSEISNATGHNENTIKRHLAKNGIAENRKRGRLSEADIDGMRGLYACGATMSTVASATGHAMVTVSKYVGGIAGEHVCAPASEQDAVVADWKSGRDVVETAEDHVPERLRTKASAFAKAYLASR